MTEREICRRLRDAGIETPAWETSLLLEHFCGRSLNAIDDQDYQSKELEAAIAARCLHTPLQYLLGEWAFYHQTYRVTDDCLIPRADTEILVEEAIRALPKNAFFADLCTGSGCVAISTLCERPDTRCVALEKFPKTLELATENAESNLVLERFSPLCVDLLTEEGKRALAGYAPFDAILSNPPYIRSSVIPTLSPEVKKEPLAALDGGDDGLLFYRAILALKHLLKPGGLLLFEIGFDQAEDISILASKAGYTDIRILKDYGGNDRVASMTLPLDKSVSI